MKLWFLRWLEWFRRRRAEKVYQALRTHAQTLSQYEPGRATLHSLLDHFHPAAFKDYRHSQASGISLSALYDNIDGYIVQLQILNAILSTGRAVAVTYAAVDASSIRVHEFFTSREGYYLDVPGRLQAFKDAAIILCTHLQASDDATFGEHDHNRRILTKVLVNLRQLVISFIELEHEIPT